MRADQVRLYNGEKFNERYSNIIAKNPFDETNDLAITNIVPDSLKVRLQNPEIRELMMLGEEELTARLNPNIVLRRIRASIWIEYNRIHDRVTYGYPGGKIVDYALGPMRFCHGVCHPQYFTDKVLPNNLCMAYIFTPPPEYDLVLREALQVGVEKLRDILNFPMYETVYVGGELMEKPNTKVADIVLKAFAVLDLRLNGSIPKTINQNVVQESRNLHYNVNGNSKAQQPIDTNKIGDALMTIEDLDERITKIRDETNKLINRPEIKGKDREYVYSKAGEATDPIIDKVPNE